MFFIPPLITLLGLTGRGEFFHPRTKVLNVSQDVTGFGLPRAENERNQLIPHYQIKANTPKEAEEIQQKILKYIKDHHEVFKKK